MRLSEAFEVDPSGVRDAAAVVGEASAALRSARSRLATAAVPGGYASSTIAATVSAATTWMAYVDRFGQRLDALAAGLRLAASRYTECDAASSQRFSSTGRQQ